MHFMNVKIVIMDVRYSWYGLLGTVSLGCAAFIKVCPDYVDIC